MIDYSIINGRTVRTTFFILFVGGLYFLLSSLVTTFCNTVLFGWIHIPCITTLEGAGIIGFLCVIYFGISFGLKYKNEKMFGNSQKSKINTDSINNNQNKNNANVVIQSNPIDEKDFLVNLNDLEDTDNLLDNELINYKDAIKEKKSTTNISDSKCLKTIEKMTKEQKLQLQLTLAKSCGIELESKIETKN